MNRQYRKLCMYWTNRYRATFRQIFNGSCKRSVFLKKMAYSPFSVRRSGRFSNPSGGQKESKKNNGSSIKAMPKMPDLVIPPSQLSDEEGGNEEEKNEEKKMAEIIIKLQVAKQRSAEKKKRKRQDEYRSQLYVNFVKENDAILVATKRRRISAHKKLHEKKTDIAKSLQVEFKNIKDVMLVTDESNRRLVDEAVSMNDALRRVLQSLEVAQNDLKNVFQIDFAAAKDEVDIKMQELDRAIKEMTNTSVDDKFSVLLSAVLKTFEI